MASSKETYAIGIYLGKAYSCVGVWHHGHVEIIANDQGNHTTPSCVAFTSTKRLIGEVAMDQADINPTNTIFDIYNLIGMRFSDPTFQSYRKRWPFNVIQGAGDKPKIVVQYKGEEEQFMPEQLSAMILEKMKEIAENFLECRVQNVVVTVPAYFSDSQRRATKYAGEMAGLNVIHIMDEPSAAVLAYGPERLTCILKEKNVLVFDLGIGTLDVSVLENKQEVFKVKAMARDMHLGGEDFNSNLLTYFLQEIQRKHNKDISGNPKSIRSLQSACEQAKKTLSTSRTAEVTFPYDGIDFSLSITQACFEELNMDVFKRCMGLVTKCLEDACIDKSTIDIVVLVGGSTQIPMVQQMLQEFFVGKDLCKSIKLNEVVAYGATLQAAMLNHVPHEHLRDLRIKYQVVPPFKLGEGGFGILKEGSSQGPKESDEKRDDRTSYTAENVKRQNNLENANEEGCAHQLQLSKADKIIEQLKAERDDARKHLEKAQKLIAQLMSEIDDATKLPETNQKLTEQLMSKRDDARKQSKADQKLMEQLMSERDDAIKLLETNQKLTEQLMSERDDARKHSEADQKIIEQLMSERDNVRNLSETSEEITEELIPERDDTRKLLEAIQKLTQQLEEFPRLREQQAPGSQCVGYFVGYSYSELQHATNNFHDSSKLGEGEFGKVYKGIHHNTIIAIKIMKKGSSQGEKEYHQEVEVLREFQHPNIVKLIGACAEMHALIYEYLPNGSLDDRLRCKNNTSPLSWQARVRIAFEICSALSFLHSSKPHGVVHGDLKPDNILLDGNDKSKISDFGLSRVLELTTSASTPFHLTRCPRGTFAYVDPEYLTTMKMTPQNDVYSFGIMLLELVTCKDPLGIRELVEEAQRKGTLKALIDASAGPWPFKEAKKMISLGLRCSHTMRKKRPDLSTVVLKKVKSMAEVASASKSSWAASLFP